MYALKSSLTQHIFSRVVSKYIIHVASSKGLEKVNFTGTGMKYCILPLNIWAKAYSIWDNFYSGIGTYAGGTCRFCLLITQIKEYPQIHANNPAWTWTENTPLLTPFSLNLNSLLVLCFEDTKKLHKK